MSQSLSGALFDSPGPSNPLRAALRAYSPLGKTPPRRQRYGDGELGHAKLAFSFSGSPNPYQQRLERCRSDTQKTLVRNGELLQSFYELRQRVRNGCVGDSRAKIEDAKHQVVPRLEGLAEEFLARRPEVARANEKLIQSRPRSSPGRGRYVPVGGDAGATM